MSGWLLAWLVIGLASTLLLVAWLLFVIYHGVLLARTARRVQDELGPILDEVTAEARRAGDRAASLQPPGRSGSRRRRR